MAVHDERLLHHIRRLASAAPADSAADGALLDRFVRRQDEEAFAVLVSRHGPLVQGVCRRLLRDAHLAEDVAQAVFLVLARRAASIRPTSSLAAWLHGTARHLALTARRAETRRRRRELQVAAPSASADPLDELTGRELLAILDAELQRLPRVYQLPLVLCCLEGHSPEEAARLLEWTPGSLKGRLERGRAQLHRRLARRGVALPALLLALEAARQTTTASAMPVPMIAATTRAALAFAVGQNTASDAAVELARGALRGMAMIKLLLLTGLVLAAGVVAAGVGAGLQAPAPDPMATNQTPPLPQAVHSPHTDLYGDALPQGAITRIGTVRLQHASSVTAIAYSPDGKMLASSSADNSVQLWDLTTGRKIRHLATDAGRYGLVGIAFSRNGKTLMSSGEAGVHIWDVASGKQIRRLPPKTPVPQHFAVSSDGRSLAFVDWDSIQLWDLATFTQRCFLHGHSPLALEEIAFSPDGQTIAGIAEDQKAGDSCVCLYDVATGRQKERLPIKARSWLAYSPDGKRLAVACQDLTICLWDTVAGREHRRLKGHQGRPLHFLGGVAFSPDGKLLASVGVGEPVRLWDPTTGEEVRRLSTRPDDYSSVAFSPDGKALAAAGHSSGRIYLWDVASGQEQRVSAQCPQGNCVALLSPDSKTLITWGGSPAGDGPPIRLHATSTGEELRRLDASARNYSRLALSPDGRTLAIPSSDADMRGYHVSLWDLQAGKELRQLPGDNSTAAFLSDGRLLTAGRVGRTPGPERLLHLWQSATGPELRSFRVPTAPQGIHHLDVSPNGKIVVAGTMGDPGELGLYDLATGRQLWRTPVSNLAFAFSPGSHILLTSGSMPVNNTKEEFWEEIRLWEVATGSQVRSFGRQAEPYTAMALSPDGRTLATGSSSGLIRLWDLATGRPRRRLRGHEWGVSSLAFSTDGRLLVSASFDHTALVWELMDSQSENRLASRPLSPGELEACWSDLAHKDAARAYQAELRLAAAPQAVSFLTTHLPTEPPAEPARLAALIKELDDDDFAVRQRATAQLERLGGRAEAALQKALEGPVEPDARRRIEGILAKLDPTKSPKALRWLRAVEALEAMGTPQARAVLRSLARDGEMSWLREEAEASSARLARRMNP